MAGVLAVPLVLLDGMGRNARREYRTLFSLSLARSVWLYWRQQANLLFEHAWQYRVIAGRESPRQYEFRMVASDDAQAVLSGNGSIVMASGHFIRGPAMLALSIPELGRRTVYIVAAEPPTAPAPLGPASAAK